MIPTTIAADHEGEFVVLKSSQGKIARISPEDAMKLASDLFDAADKALQGASEDN